MTTPDVLWGLKCPIVGGASPKWAEASHLHETAQGEHLHTDKTIADQLAVVAAVAAAASSSLTQLIRWLQLRLFLV